MRSIGSLASLWLRLDELSFEVEDQTTDPERDPARLFGDEELSHLELRFMPDGELLAVNAAKGGNV